MTVSSRSAMVALVLACIACGGATTAGGAGGSGGAGSGGFGGKPDSGATSGGTGAAGSGGTGAAGSGGTGAAGSGGTSCESVGCGQAPLCSDGCQEPCGCCSCALGQVQYIGGVSYSCLGDCWGPSDGGPCSSDGGDSPCPPGYDCLLRADGEHCVARVGEGQSCGPPFGAPFCASDLVCSLVGPYVRSATCRVACGGDAECPLERYCSPAGVCRDDGTCFDDKDCDLANNTYARQSCLGYGDCANGTCTYVCGSRDGG